MQQPLFLVGGFIFVGIAAVGFILPVLPGTPFLLLAAWCFARSSERWHQRLLQSALFGPTIQKWEQTQCISQRTKVFALGSMLIVGGSSVMFAIESMQLRIITTGFMIAGATMVLSLPTCSRQKT